MESGSTQPSNSLAGEKSHETPLSMKVACFGIRKKFPEVSQLATEQLAAWIKEEKPVTLLDTRPECEYRVSRIAGAIRIEPENLEQGLSEAETVIGATPKDQPVVMYCSVGYRSSMVATRLLQRANSQVADRPIYNLEGSIFKWANEDRPIVDSEGRQAHAVHPFNAIFGKLLHSSKRFNS